MRTIPGTASTVEPSTGSEPITNAWADAVGDCHKRAEPIKSRKLNTSAATKHLYRRWRISLSRLMSVLAVSSKDRSRRFQWKLYISIDTLARDTASRTLCQKWRRLTTRVATGEEASVATRMLCHNISALAVAD